MLFEYARNIVGYDIVQGGLTTNLVADHVVFRKRMESDKAV
jgi:hypothetical protein